MTTLKTIDKNIKTITTNAAKLNRLIHDTGMMIMRHAQEHGDCTRALTLVRAMPASMRRTMLVAWFDKYSPIRVLLSDKNSDRVGILKKDAKNYVEWNLEGAEAEPFYEIAEATPEKPALDFEALLAMVQRLAKQIDKKVEEGAVLDKDVESAKALARAVSGLKVSRVSATPVNDAEPKTTSLAEEIKAAA